ncbi:PKD domain-containing protein [Flavobacterium amnicola]|uniref:PKD domain-containing protein n=1 Tax=Flavobacterium amnicola TaxID=2506422 RepID=A0A4Q1K1W5_9FLAO|nr:gliding motility-associated C-terminal domain-containing protein [Flavobacterium amnicola]RXR19013.1 PKD domain-containing protein [Flavobacterium amnicola]
MFNYKPYFISLFFFLGNFIFAQSSCPNSDFSNSDFTNWEGYNGNYQDPGLNVGFIQGRHTIITTNTLDPNTCNNLNTIPTGSSYSAQLGNSSTNAEAEKLIYKINVTPQNSLFIYKYAVVLEDPFHLPEEQPNFDVKILDANGNTIDPTCGAYNVYAGQPGQNFQSCGIVKWLPWNTVGLNLTPYIGNQVSIEFTTRDCSLSAHFGYAYIAAYCSQLRINVKTCTGDPNIVLSAPPGFATYSWSFQGVPVGTATQSITVPQALYPVGSIFDCTMTSFSNGSTCPAQIQAIISDPATIMPNYNYTFNCGNNSIPTANNPIQFNDLSTAINSTITGWLWDFGDGTTSTLQNPSHAFATQGIYTVTLNAISESGCSKSIALAPITIVNNTVPTPTASDNQVFCINDNPTVADLTASGTSIGWFSTPALGTALTPNTPLINGATYYAESVINDCSSSIRKPVVVTILNASPAPTGPSPQSFCANDKPTLNNLIINGVNIKWYNSITSNNPLTLNTPLLNGTYYATQNTIGCESSIRTAIQVQLVDPKPIGNTFQEFCKIDNPQISDLIITGSNIKWYSSPTGGSVLPPNTFLRSSDYYASQTDINNCESLSRLKVTVKLNDISAPNSIAIQDFCIESKPLLSNIKIYGNKIKWYTSSTDSNMLLSNTPIINGNTYYASQIDPVSKCESSTRTAVTTYLYPCDLNVYNTISPNGNDLNDKFIIKNIETFPENKLEIYNRYGELVYKSNRYGIDSNYFYGFANKGLIFQDGNKLPTGTYYYILNYQRESLEINKTIKGFLYINNNE